MEIHQKMASLGYKSCCREKKHIKNRQKAVFYQAGRQGFEPWVEFYSDNHLAGGPDRPLRHLPKI